MDVKNRVFTFTLIASFLFLFFSANAFSATNQLFNTTKPITPNAGIAIRSSIIFRIQGNVYPLGHYSMILGIGNPPKPFNLDIDSGSDLTWVQCDAPCKGCTRPRNELYKPHGNLVHCGEPLCDAVQSRQRSPRCHNANDQCDFEVQYADHGSSLGVLLRDYVPLRLINGTAVRPFLAFGCGYDLHFSGNPPSTIGVLGIGNGQESLLSQLHGQGFINNVVGHCLSGKGGGFIFFGDQLVPQSGIVWTPMLHTPENHYTAGPVDLFFNGKATSIKGLQLTFDSGSSYTYLNSQAYRALVDLVINDLKGKPLTIATEDRTLTMCWKGPQPFKSLGDVSKYFNPLVLSFTNPRNLQLQLPLQAYLIISTHGNVCLGILDGTRVGLGNVNLIGDISLQDKLVVYDNEKQQIGWAPANCNRNSQVMNQSIVISSFTGN